MKLPHPVSLLSVGFSASVRKLLTYALPVWAGRAVAESWQPSARKPVYFVFFLILGVIIFESQTYRWAGGWTFEGV
eukprot:4824373-Pyramimonas_sp.AAC.1